jgi:DNA/RNA endonuclease YhcR with UshA esterase domain
MRLLCGIADGGVVKTRACAVRILIILALMATAIAQQKNGPKYDLSTEATLKGTVAEVKEVPKSCLGETGLHLVLTTDAGPVEIQVGPAQFLQSMEVAFAKGDKLQVLGSKVTVDGAALVLAREVTQNNNVVVMRDQKGAPVWNWGKKS